MALMAGRSAAGAVLESRRRAAMKTSRSRARPSTVARARSSSLARSRSMASAEGLAEDPPRRPHAPGRDAHAVHVLRVLAHPGALLVGLDPLQLLEQHPGPGGGQGEAPERRAVLRRRGRRRGCRWGAVWRCRRCAVLVRGRRLGDGAGRLGCLAGHTGRLYARRQRLSAAVESVPGRAGAPPSPHPTPRATPSAPHHPWRPRDRTLSPGGETPRGPPPRYTRQTAPDRWSVG